MFDKIWTYLKFGNRFCCIEYTSNGSEELLRCITLKKTKAEAIIDEQFKAASAEELGKKLPKHQHAFLIINDDQVLTKLVEGNQKESVALVNNAFPNISLNDFYYEILHQGNTHFISLARKSHVDNILKTIQEVDIHIIDFSLGNSSISKVTNYVNSEVIRTSNSNIQLKDNLITSITKSNSQSSDAIYDVNGLKVSSSYLLALSGALSSLLGDRKSTPSFKAEKQLLFNEFKQVRFFNLFSKFALAFLLGILLTNFLVFNNYYNNVNTLQATSQVNQNAKARLLSLNENVSKTEKMMNDMLKSSSSKSSFYVNDVVLSLPNSVLLSELNYQPLLKRIKADKPIEIDGNAIVLYGTSNDSEAFSKWLAELEALSWIQKIDIIEYGSETNRISNFSIKILLND